VKGRARSGEVLGTKSGWGKLYLKFLAHKEVATDASDEVSAHNIR
jgi:hypothetical protein